MELFAHYDATKLLQRTVEIDPPSIINHPVSPSSHEAVKTRFDENGKAVYHLIYPLEHVESAFKHELLKMGVQFSSENQDFPGATPSDPKKPLFRVVFPSAQSVNARLNLIRGHSPIFFQETHAGVSKLIYWRYLSERIVLIGIKNLKSFEHDMFQHAPRYIYLSQHLIWLEATHLLKLAFFAHDSKADPKRHKRILDEVVEPIADELEFLTDQGLQYIEQGGSISNQSRLLQLDRVVEQAQKNLSDILRENP
jgi:hypothetical protein